MSEPTAQPLSPRRPSGWPSIVRRAVGAVVVALLAVPAAAQEDGPAAARLAGSRRAPVVVQAPVVDARTPPRRPADTRADLAGCRGVFRSLDRSADGLVDRTEATAAGVHPLDFLRGDTGRDGRLDAEEFTLAYSRLLSHRGRPLAADLAAETTRLAALEKLRSTTARQRTAVELELERQRRLRERTAPVGPSTGRRTGSPPVRVIDG